MDEVHYSVRRGINLFALQRGGNHGIGKFVM